jgi:hypothetical protein
MPLEEGSGAPGNRHICADEDAWLAPLALLHVPRDLGHDFVDELPFLRSRHVLDRLRRLNRCYESSFGHRPAIVATAIPLAAG